MTVIIGLFIVLIACTIFERRLKKKNIAVELWLESLRQSASEQQSQPSWVSCLVYEIKKSIQESDKQLRKYDYEPRM